MASLAHIFRLIRVAAAFAVILALGFSLPTAAHTLAGHHDNAAASRNGESHAGAALQGAAHAGTQSGAHDKHDASQNTADTGNCCAGACMALAILSLQPDEFVLKRSRSWKMAHARLPSRGQMALLRPPRT